MYKLSFVLLITLTNLSLFAQKEKISKTSFEDWSFVSNATISNDGNYVSYLQKKNNQDAGILIIQSRQGKQIKALKNIKSFDFCPNSKYFFSLTNSDSLLILDLKTGVSEDIPNCNSFHLFQSKGISYSIYTTSSIDRILTLRNLFNNEEKKFRQISNHWLSNSGKILILEEEQKRGNNVTYIYKTYNVIKRRSNIFWQNIRIQDLTFNKKESHIAFKCLKNSSHKTSIEIWYYDFQKYKFDLLLSDKSLDSFPGLKVGSLRDFSFDDTNLHLNLDVDVTTNNELDIVPLHLWSYKDSMLQSQQLLNANTERSYSCLINLSNKKLFRIEDQNDYQSNNIGQWSIIYHKNGYEGEGEMNWNSASLRSVYLFSEKSMTKNLIKENTLLSYNISPHGRFLIYFEPLLNNYFSYEISTKKERNITKSIKTNWYESDRPGLPYGLYEIAGWLGQDSSILIYDKNDIWQIDPLGNRSPINLTNGLGKIRNIQFRLAIDLQESLKLYNSKLLLSAFNFNNKENGFYNIFFGGNIDPEKLIMEPVIYNVPTMNGSLQGMQPIKAKNANIFLVKRMRASESPNFYLTEDFKIFSRLSNVFPEKKFNWVTSELHTWYSSNGEIMQGVLYKPENFDSTKKYPLIFYYYETLSDRLNLYIRPEPSDCRLNIPFFVSNEFLIFTPDIHFSQGDPGESILTSLISATKYLGKFNFIDNNNMGIQGCSFGGFATNYLITHTSLFKAACSSAGLSDFISSYGTINGNGHSMQGIFEHGQTRIGATLWERPDLYIKNSPVFNANNVTTPLLMMHTKDDGAVSFNQAIEFFTGLRRLGKKVWLLEYLEGNHGIYGRSADDFTARMMQFFNYYLKDQPPPLWMTKGIPAAFKRKKLNLELDSIQNIP